jgi:hypothetical protein
MDMGKLFSPYAGVTNFVHIGLVVEDLEATVRFLSLLGFDCGSPGCSAASGSIGSSVWRM